MIFKVYLYWEEEVIATSHTPQFLFFRSATIATTTTNFFLARYLALIKYRTAI